MRQCELCQNWVHYDDECCPVCQALRERDEARGELKYTQVCLAARAIERDKALALLARSDEKGTKAVAGWKKACRERDEAQAVADSHAGLIAELRELLTHEEDEHNRWRKAAETHRRERDEALIDAANLRHERDEVDQKLVSALRERDEAMDLCNTLTGQVNAARSERDEARAQRGTPEDQARRNLNALCVTAAQRDAAQAVAAKLYSGQPLSPTEHDLARDWLPRSALEGP